MKAKYDLIKMAGWVAVAIGGLAASWATDKQSKEEINKKLNKTAINEKRQEDIIQNLLKDKSSLEIENTELNTKIKDLNECISKMKKEIEDRKQFAETISKNREKQSEEYLNKLASKLKIEYTDFCDAREVEMTLDLGENMRSQLEAVFSILEKNGVKLK